MEAEGRRLYRKMLIACRKLETTWAAVTASDVTGAPLNMTLKYQQSACLHKCLPFCSTRKPVQQHRFSGRTQLSLMDRSASPWPRGFYLLRKQKPFRKAVFREMTFIASTFKQIWLLVNKFLLKKYFFTRKQFSVFISRDTLRNRIPAQQTQRRQICRWRHIWVDTKNSAPTSTMCSNVARARE